MPDYKSETNPQDASRINVHERYEVEYWSKKFEVTPEQLKDAVAKVGVSAKAVEKELTHQRAAMPDKHDFRITFAPELTPQQIKATLEALADYYRACGGVGLKIDFEMETVQILEPINV